MKEKLAYLGLACFVSAIFVGTVYCQQNPEDLVLLSPTPAIGWDSLAARIEYPITAIEAGIQGEYSCVASFSKEGKLDSLDLRAAPAVFQDAITRALHSTAWSAGRQGRDAIPSRITIPVEFHLSTSATAPKIIINKERKMKVKVVRYQDLQNSPR